MPEARSAAMSALELALHCNTTLTIRLMTALISSGALATRAAKELLIAAADGVDAPLAGADIDAAAFQALGRYVSDLRSFAASMDSLED